MALVGSRDEPSPGLPYLCLDYCSISQWPSPPGPHSSNSSCKQPITPHLGVLTLLQVHSDGFHPSNPLSLFCIIDWLSWHQTLYFLFAYCLSSSNLCALKRIFFSDVTAIPSVLRHSKHSRYIFVLFFYLIPFKHHLFANNSLPNSTLISKCLFNILT